MRVKRQDRLAHGALRLVVMVMPRRGRRRSRARHPVEALRGAVVVTTAIATRRGPKVQRLENGEIDLGAQGQPADERATEAGALRKR